MPVARPPELVLGDFDPYLVWLDIPPHERPANHYRLLGLRLLERDPQTIAAAADRVIAHISQFQNTAHAARCQQLLAEIHAARACLLDATRKAAYDSGLGSTGAPAERPLAGPAAGPSAGQRPIAAGPQIPTSVRGGLPTAGERQIPQSPPVPSSPGAQTSPGVSPISIPAQPLPAPQGIPQSAPSSPVPHTGGETPLPQPVAGGDTATGPMPTPVAQRHPQPDQPAAQAIAGPPPAWAVGGRTGEVSTVTPGDGETQPISAQRSSRGRVLRRQQQTQSAYLLVAFALAMIVFFFGAVLLLAIYLTSQ